MERPPFTMFAGSDEGLAALDELVGRSLAAVRAGLAERSGPLPTGGPLRVAADPEVLDEAAFPEEGVGDVAALEPLARAFAWGSVDLTHPATAAFLQCPALAVAAAADLVVSALNQSVDVWDSGPFAMELEQRVLRALCDLVGLPEGSAGVMTPGGSISNLLAVVLARDVAGSRLSGRDLSHGGPRESTGRLRVVCSRDSHVSVGRAVAAAGLGEDGAVVAEPDALGVMDVASVKRALAAIPVGDLPCMLIANAGTTDLGAIDRLEELSELAARQGMWFHVDAAYGGGMLVSSRLRGRFAGIERADSVTIDLHKMAWHPASASVLLVRREADFAPLHREAPYLNPADDESAGLPNRLGRTLETTRRADVLKVAAVFRAVGRRGLADLVDRCHDLARYTESLIIARTRLELAAPVSLTRVVFRYLPGRPEQADEVNAALRRRLLNEGRAVLGRTRRGERIFLKFTMINPLATERDIDELIAVVEEAGKEEERRVLLASR
ncbi:MULTISPECIES: pyridoxal-dependent decarboxylase [unclassified Nonomuraea]|uniref:pyridoxal phosphate-dependent decarboxylase family protein n=1 Tax=unclassified Nonomuraea TaxID=2593643 RepID=UPI0033FCF2C6